jgi:hypothetical protein
VTKRRWVYSLARVFAYCFVPILAFSITFLSPSQLLEHNIRTIKMNPFDYKDVDPDAAVKDFNKRRENYINIYETVDERDGSHIKIINNQTYIVHNVRGYLPQKVRHGDAYSRLLSLLLLRQKT